jgi:hypothetical protein
MARFLAILFSLGHNEEIMREVRENDGLFIFYNFGVKFSGVVDSKKIVHDPLLPVTNKISKLSV